MKKKIEATVATLLDDIRKWQEEETQNRAIFCIVCDEKQVSSSVLGTGKNLIDSICNTMEEDLKIESLVASSIAVLRLHRKLVETK